MLPTPTLIPLAPPTNALQGPTWKTQGSENPKSLRTQMTGRKCPLEACDNPPRIVCIAHLFHNCRPPPPLFPAICKPLVLPPPFPPPSSSQTLVQQLTSEVTFMHEWGRLLRKQSGKRHHPLCAVPFVDNLRASLHPTVIPHAELYFHFPEEETKAQRGYRASPTQKQVPFRAY